MGLFMGLFIGLFMDLFMGLFVDLFIVYCVFVYSFLKFVKCFIFIMQFDFSSIFGSWGVRQRILFCRLNGRYNFLYRVFGYGKVGVLVRFLLFLVWCFCRIEQLLFVLVETLLLIELAQVFQTQVVLFFVLESGGMYLLLFFQFFRWELISIECLYFRKKISVVQ